jgi:hypothetical protein
MLLVGDACRQKIKWRTRQERTRKTAGSAVVSDTCTRASQTHLHNARGDRCELLQAEMTRGE